MIIQVSLNFKEFSHKMTITGIIAEYNPLHNGHAFLIRELQRLGANPIAVVMSGNFVQRGEAAVLSKWARTKQALLCGADLVLELPLPWAVAGAEHFAIGGVSVLTALGADIIGFGSECGDIDRLNEARRALAAPQLHEAIQKSLQGGATFAAARQKAVDSLFGNETALLLREPNNILGIEYMKAIDLLGSSMKPYTIKRSGALHQEEQTVGETASSSAIRSMMSAGEDFSKYMPEQAYQVAKGEIIAGRAPANLAFLERGILTDLRRMGRKDLSRLPDISEGLENRIFTAVQKAGSLPELFRLVKTRRYTMARIRRIILSAFLGIDASLSAGTPPYLRILGIGKNGDKILQTAKQKSQLPIISRYSDLNKLDSRAVKVMELENRAADLYALCMPHAAPCGLDRSSKLIVL
jgi:predicted nucleotidyltransferase